MKRLKLDEIKIEDYDSLVKLFHKESARGAAVLAGSYLEYYLGKYIRHFMQEDIDEEKLFEGFGPFSTFAQRIEAAYALKLISKKDKEDLKNIKEIRNRFAHHPKYTTFKTKEIKELCGKLSIVEHNFASEFFKGPRFQYLCTISKFIMRAHNRMLEFDKNKPR